MGHNYLNKVLAWLICHDSTKNITGEITQYSLVEYFSFYKICILNRIAINFASLSFPKKLENQQKINIGIYF